MTTSPVFDVRALGMVSLMAPTLFAMATLYLHRLWPRERSLPYWAAGGIVLASAYLLNGLRGTGPDFLVLVVANTLGLLSVCLLIVAGRVLVGLPDHVWWVLPVALGAAAFLTFFTYVRPNLGLRVQASTVANLVGMAILAWLFWHHSHGRMRLPGRAIATIFGVCAGAYLIRLWAARDLAPEATLGSARTVVVLIPFVSGFIVAASLSMLLTLAVSYQIEAELTLERERTDEANQALRHVVATDALTGVSSRGTAEEMLAAALAAAIPARPAPPAGPAPTAGPVAVLMLDIDGFKLVNDTFGHGVGDRVLQDVAAALLRTTQPPGIIGRWGGEEFLIVAPGADGPAAAALAEELRQAVSTVRRPDGRAVTVSVGLAGSRPSDSVSTLVTRADDAMYRAKRGGAIGWFPPERRTRP